MKKLFISFSVIAVVASFSALLVPQTTFAACTAGSASANQVLTGVGDTGPCNTNGVGNIAEGAVKIISYVAGVLAIIMVIVAGFKYIVSGGDSGKVGSAKNTLIYALVGIAIAVFAQFLVHFVINASNKAAG